MKLIAAVDTNWGIGKNNNLLFEIPDDMKFFRQTTLEKTIVMGKNTLLSLPNGKPLKNRQNVVLSAETDFFVEGATVVNTLEQLAQCLKKYNSDDIFVVGGGSVYELLCDYCDGALITKVNANGNADVFFPNLDKKNNWIQTKSTKKLSSGGYEYAIITYENTKPKQFDEEK